MNFSQLGIALNMSRSGARSLVLRNKTKLKKYLIVKNKNVVGVDENAIDDIRQLTQRTTNIAYKRDKDIELLKTEIEYLNRLMLEKDKTIEILQNSNEQLKGELDYYRSLGFFQRLLGYKSKK